MILADSPELAALASLASVAPSKVAEAINDPLALLEHLTLEELGRLRGATDRLAALSGLLATTTRQWLDGAKAATVGAPSAV